MQHLCFGPLLRERARPELRGLFEISLLHRDWAAEILTKYQVRLESYNARAESSKVDASKPKINANVNFAGRHQYLN